MVNPEVWLAPAKINLFLRITGRRADGMHELQTAFQFIDLCDELNFSLRADGLIEQGVHISSVSEAEDLCIRAARLLQQAADLSLGVSIFLKKRIPIGGGLGGASTDAATTLHALNQLWHAGLSVDELAKLGEQLGADVPVFVNGVAAWAEGIGEKLTPIEIEESWYVLADPGVHVSTREMFADSQLTRNCPKLTICPPKPGEFGNVFEPIVRKAYPAVDGVFDWLTQYGQPFVTGTGGCVLMPAKDRELALNIRAQAPNGVMVSVVQGKNRSPLMKQLSA